MKKLLKKTLWGYILTYAITFFIVIGLLIPIYSMAYNSSRRVIVPSGWPTRCTRPTFMPIP